MFYSSTLACCWAPDDVPDMEQPVELALTVQKGLFAERGNAEAAIAFQFPRAMENSPMNCSQWLREKC